MSEQLKKKLLEHPRNRRIKFYEDEHRYEYFPDLRKNEGVKFNGITGWFGQYCSKFDADKVAESCNKNPNSEYYQMGEDAIKQVWNERRIEGSNIHKAIENVVNYDGLYDEEYGNYIDAFFDVMDKHGIEPIVCEHVIYDEDVERATPIDVVGMRDGKIVPLDVKTYEKGMQFVPYGNKTMLHPLGELKETKYLKTCLQIMIERKFLLKHYGFKENEIEDGMILLMNEEVGCKAFPVLDVMDYVDKLYQYE